MMCSAMRDLRFRAKSMDGELLLRSNARSEIDSFYQNVKLHHTLNSFFGFAMALIWAGGLDFGFVFHQPHSKAKRARCTL